jgi:hypothetical protein
MTITTHVNRRDFLLMRSGRDSADRGQAILSCEQLYMRYVDARAQGTTAELFARLAHDLEDVTRVRLIKTSWLSDDDLKRELDVVFDAFRERGGRIEH